MSTAHRGWWAGPDVSWYNEPDKKMPLGVEGWKNQQLRLRVCRSSGPAFNKYYAAPYEGHVFLDHYLTLRIGPYATLKDAMLAAEMIGEIKGE